MPLDPHETVARDPRPAGEPGVSQLIRETSAQVRDAIEKSRLEVAQLIVRVARVEDEINCGQGVTRSLAWLAGIAALLGFLTTSLTWQVSHRAAEIDSAIRSVAALMKRSAGATEVAFTKIDATLATQGVAAEKLAAAIASVEVTGRRMQEALADLDRDADHAAEATGLIGRQLTDTAIELSTLRRELDARLERHHDAFVAGRGEMLEAVTSSIGRVESGLLRQAEELRSQRQQVDASAARMRHTQQRMLGEATQAVAAQLEGLRQILDGLKVEIAEGEATVALEAATRDLDPASPTIVEPVTGSDAAIEAELAAESPAEQATLDAVEEAASDRAVDAVSDAADAAGDEADAEPVAEVAAEKADTVTE